jgi:hypothetical protein
MKHLAVLIVLFCLGTITLAQDTVVITDEDGQPAISAVVDTSNRNAALTTVAFIGLSLFAVALIGLSAYTSHLASKGIPASDVVKFIEAGVNAVKVPLLQAGASIASNSPSTLDDTVFTALLRANGWQVETDSAGKIVQAVPPKAPDTSTVSGALNETA